MDADRYWYGTKEFAAEAGGRYSGEFREDLRSGVGRMDWPSGESYEGLWAGGVSDGRGGAWWGPRSLIPLSLSLSLSLSEGPFLVAMQDGLERLKATPMRASS